MKDQDIGLTGSDNKVLKDGSNILGEADLEACEKAQIAVDEADKNVTNAQDLVESAHCKYDDAYLAIEEPQEILDDARQALSDAWQALSDAEQIRDEANKALEDAKAQS